MVEGKYDGQSWQEGKTGLYPVTNHFNNVSVFFMLPGLLKNVVLGPVVQN